MTIIKKMTKKCRYFPKVLCIWDFRANEMECEMDKQDFSKKVIIPNATSVLILQYKNARKTSFKKCYTIGLYWQIC